MQKYLKTTLLISSIIVSLNTGFTEEAVKLNLGIPAPFAGVLIPFDKAEEMRKQLIERDGLVKLVSSYERSTSLQDLNFKLSQEQVNILQEQNTSLRTQVSYSEYTKYLWLGLGIVGTSLAVWSAGNLR